VFTFEVSVPEAHLKRHQSEAIKKDRKPSQNGGEKSIWRLETFWFDGLAIGNVIERVSERSNQKE
jgi:hypothetical protein